MTRSSWEDEKKSIEGGFRWECSHCSHTGNVLVVAVSALTLVSDVYIYDVRHQAASSHRTLVGHGGEHHPMRDQVQIVHPAPCAPRVSWSLITANTWEFPTTGARPR